MLSVPLKVVTFPVGLAALLVKEVLGAALGPGPPNPVTAAVADVSAWGLSPVVGKSGPRSSFGGGLHFERFHPFFLRSWISIRGSQLHAGGFENGWAGSGSAWGLEGGFRRYAEPHFWGIGPDTDPDGETDYRWDQAFVAGGSRLRAGPVAWSGAVAWEENTVHRGFDRSSPDLQDVADPDTLFGLGEETRYVRVGGSLALDLTRLHALQRRGLLVEAGGTGFFGVGGTDSDFLRWNGELATYLPLNDRQQLAIRGLAELNRSQSGRGIPFTHLASLGGSHKLRGFDRDRFRDRDLLAVSSEWRYEVWREKLNRARTEGFLFLDWGTVAERLDKLDGSDLRSSWGFGMRAIMEGQLALLWYLALGGEETQFRVKFSWPY
ncbi:MAG: BamA/TamA family outer membrane protein [Gemmatimonadota bacterium]